MSLARTASPSHHVLMGGGGGGVGGGDAASPKGVGHAAEMVTFADRIGPYTENAPAAQPSCRSSLYDAKPLQSKSRPEPADYRDPALILTYPSRRSTSYANSTFRTPRWYTRLPRRLHDRTARHPRQRRLPDCHIFENYSCKVERTTRSIATPRLPSACRAVERTRQEKRRRWSGTSALLVEEPHAISFTHRPPISGSPT